MLASMQVQAERVLDLYAGTGALGIEALSRGSGWAEFVERDREACDVIRDNLRRSGFFSCARVLCMPVTRALARLEGAYDLVFLDPPYAAHEAEALMDSPRARAHLSPHAIIVYEHSRRDPPPPSMGGLPLLRDRSHGSSSVTFYGNRPLEMQA